MNNLCTILKIEALTEYFEDADVIDVKVFEGETTPRRGETMAGLIIISVLCISSAFLLWFIADKRGANTRFWALMGAVFGPLAIPFVFLTKNQSARPNRPNKM